MTLLYILSLVGGLKVDYMEYKFRVYRESGEITDTNNFAGIIKELRRAARYNKRHHIICEYFQIERDGKTYIQGELDCGFVWIVKRNTSFYI